jgi:hypothetical protein
MTFMSYEKYIKYSTEEFILDDDFMKWVLHPTQETDRTGTISLKNHPEKKQQVKEAAFMIKAMRAVEPVPFHNNGSEQVYKNAQSSSTSCSQNRLDGGKIAAIFLLLVSIGGVWYYFQNNRQSFPMELATAEQLKKAGLFYPMAR